MGYRADTDILAVMHEGREPKLPRAECKPGETAQEYAEVSGHAEQGRDALGHAAAHLFDEALILLGAVGSFRALLAVERGGNGVQKCLRPGGRAAQPKASAAHLQSLFQPGQRPCARGVEMLEPFDID